MCIKASELDFDTLHQLYVIDGLDIPRISEKYGISKWNVRNQMIRLGIPRRSKSEVTSKKPVNEHFFSEWSDEMAYVLGWIISDGHVHKSENTIMISSNDRVILDNIASVMGLVGGVHKGLNNNFILRVCREQLHRDLVRIGVKPGNRVFDQKPLEIPDKYLRHFIRGFFDGDGSITIGSRPSNGYTYYCVSFCKASNDLMVWLKDILTENLGVHVGKVDVLSKWNHMKYNVNIYSRHGTEKFYRWIYTDVQDGLWLERKKIVFENEFGSIDVLKGGDAI